MQENNIFCQEKIFLRHEQKLNWFVTLSRKKIEPENSCEWYRILQNDNQKFPVNDTESYKTIMLYLKKKAYSGEFEEQGSNKVNFSHFSQANWGQSEYTCDDVEKEKISSVYTALESYRSRCFWFLEGKRP